MNILLGSLRTGYHPDSRVFNYKEPSKVLGTLVLNNLASIVISPSDVSELLVFKNGELDSQFFTEISNFCEINQERIVIKENQSFIDWLTNQPELNDLLIVSALNRTEVNPLIEQRIEKSVDVDTLIEEKIGIEISHGKEQISLWFEDVVLKTDSNFVFETNGVSSLIFARSITIDMYEMPLYEVNVVKQIKIEESNAGDAIKNAMVEVEFKYDWPIEFDFLDIKQFESFKGLLSNYYSGFFEIYGSPQIIGNAYVLNGFRAINALYHKMNSQGLRNGLVFIEQKGIWTIIHLKKIEREGNK